MLWRGFHRKKKALRTPFGTFAVDPASVEAILGSLVNRAGAGGGGRRSYY